MKITKSQLKGDPKKIGHTKDGGSVYHLLTKGGFNIIMLKDGGKSQVVGAAPHRGLAKIIAQDKNKDIVFDELSKSDEGLEMFMHLKPTFAEVTDQLNSKLNG